MEKSKLLIFEMLLHGAHYWQLIVTARIGKGFVRCSRILTIMARYYMLFIRKMMPWATLKSTCDVMK